MKTNLLEKVAKTIILVGGDKGGVGKSTVARMLCEFYHKEQVPFLAYDGDDTNPTLTRFYKAALPLSAKNLKGYEVLLNNLEGDKPAVQIVDLGAGTSIILQEFALRTGFTQVAKDNAARVNFVFVLAPGVDSINLLKILIEQYDRQISYVVVRNEANKGTWDLWESSKTRARVLGELGGKEIVIPALDSETYSIVDCKAIMWSEVPQHQELPLALRSYVFRWQKAVFGEFTKVAEFLT